MRREWRLIETEEWDYVELAAVRQTFMERRASGLSPDTVLFVRPPRPGFICGFYVDPERSLDLDFLAARGVAWGRALTSGGVGYADAGSFLYGLWIGREEPSLPKSVAAAYAAFAPELAAALGRAFGLRARYRPLNDVELLSADGLWRKPGFCSLSADATVHQQLVNVQIARPDLELMTGALRLPPEKFSDKPTKSVADRATWLERETGRPISMRETRAMFVEFLERIFGVRLVPATLTVEERGAIAEALDRARRPEWLFARAVRGVLAEARPDSPVARVTEKVPGGPLIEIVLRLEAGRIADVRLTGSFTATPFLPRSPIEALEDRLRGIEAEEAVIGRAVESVCAEPAYEIAGVTAAQLTAGIGRAVVAARAARRGVSHEGRRTG